VAITDNADPMNVVVYRTATSLPAGQSRVVCAVPVFSAGASATENSLIGIGNSLIVENNAGYHITSTTNGAVTAPGIARIDVDDSGCAVIWSNTIERIPSVVSKVSARNGLVYTFTKDPDPTNPTADAWFWAALDFRTGALVWKQLAGTGFNYNNHYAGIVLGRDGTAYVGAVGGMLAIRDGH
jgi:outer membrane protein assembly factor BamB